MKFFPNRIHFTENKRRQTIVSIRRVFFFPSHSMKISSINQLFHKVIKGEQMKTRIKLRKKKKKSSIFSMYTKGVRH